MTLTPSMRTGVLVLLLVPFLAGSGCISLEKPYPQKRFFSIRTEREGTTRNPVSSVTVEVRSFRTAPPHDREEFAYRRGENSYDSDFYNLFVAPPSRLLTEEVRRWLRDSNLFAHLVTPGSRISATHYVEGFVTALHGDYRPDEDPAAVLEIQFLFFEETLDDTRIIFQKAFQERVPLKEGRDADALVRAWTEALRRVLQAFESGLSEHANRAALGAAD